MNLINKEELKQKLDRGDKFKLVNALGEWTFNAKHIPGFINISKLQDAKKILNPDDDIVIYCSNEACICKYNWISAFDAYGVIRTSEDLQVEYKSWKRQDIH